jgi:predicted NBD/HSP70 family sugar kinase
VTATEAPRGSAPADPAQTATNPLPGGAAALLTAPYAGGSLFANRALRASGKVLPEHARSHNRSLVLQTLYTEGAQSRADVARETGLTRVTVSDLVAELIGEGLVIELGQREDARPGKPATLIDVDRTGFHIIGLDLSEHTRFRGAVVDLDGNVVARAEVALDGATGERAVELVVELLDGLLALTQTRVLGIGVGSPGVVDPNGVVHSAPNLGWSGLALQERLAAAFHLPVHVANDANVAALAEHGSTPGDLILIKVGRGVGAGLIVGGRPVLGSGFAAGEIGHVVVGTDGGPRCACGKHGCLETWVAVPRLTAELDRVERLGDTDAAASAREETLREAGRRLGIVLAPVVGALNLSEVVLSGPAELLDGPLIEATVETLRMRTMAEQHRDLRLRMTAHGQDIVLRGAAVMVLSGQLGVS